MRLAFFSPVNPVKSGISDYSESLLQALSVHCETTLFVHDYQPSNPWITENLEVIDCARQNAAELLSRYDRILYQMGGTPSHHKYIYDLIPRYPGVVTLHDLMYHGFFADLWLKTGQRELYLEEMKRSYGAPGEEVARLVISGRHPPFDILRKFPMNRVMIDAATGIVVHSQSAAQEVAETRAGVPCRVIPHHDFGWSEWEEFGYEPETSRGRAKERLGLQGRTRVLASFGFVVATKRPEVALRAFARLRKQAPDSAYIFVGEEQYRISEYARFLELDDSVRITGFVTQDQFRSYLEAADLCVNLRYPSQGETSGAVLRMLALAKPVIVTNHGWFAELPEGACAKVDPDEYEEELLYEFYRALTSREEYSRSMSSNAYRYIRENCALPLVAGQYLDFLAECGSRG